MNLKEIGQNNKKSLPFISLITAAIFAGVLIIASANHRQYSSGIVTMKESDDENDNGVLGMAQYFFTARKNVTTNTMDYPSMLAADIADRGMLNTHNMHGLSAATAFTFTWNSVGPTNIGGRTRAFLIDKNDPTHQTLFAGGVSGGIWKSTNGGGNWGNGGVSGISYSQNDTLKNINVASIAQDANGAIYIGTGEGFSVLGYQTGQGFSTGMLGGGIFKSIDDGNTWRLLPKTVPSSANNNGIAWAYVNRIAIRPDNFKTIYAATNGGVFISRDSGATWRSAYSPSHSALSGNSLDLKISNDGSIIVACIGGSGYYCYPQSNDSIFTEIAHTGAGHLPAGGSRIEFAIAPSDPNRIYASFIDNTGVFGTGASASGIFMTETAQTNGGYWYKIAPGGSNVFNPYLSGTQDQSTYDNTLGVSPSNEGELLCGGVVLWSWTQLNENDTVGSWNKVSHNQSGAGDPLYIHSDEHTIVFDQTNPNTVYVGCDGGVFQCTNFTINPSNIENSIKLLSFQAINRNYNITQYYTICFSPQVNFANQLGVGGGTQDNGSPYISGDNYYQYDGIDIGGGDGAGCAVSSLNPNIAYVCSDYGTLLKTADLNASSPPVNLVYTKTTGIGQGGNIDSVWNAASAAPGGSQVCFVCPVALYENSYDTLNHDSLTYIADSNYSKGHTIWPQDANGPTRYPYVIPRALAKGDTLTVPDRVVSRLAVGFSPNYYVWINGQGASTGNVIWIPIAGPNSTPTAYTGTSPIHSLCWTPDGNTLFVGCEDGTFFRFSNINSIIADNYSSGALFYEQAGKGVFKTPNQVVSTNLGNMGRDILSIAVDPENGNNVLVTLGNYGSATYVYYSNNALAATPTFNSVQGNLPAMPVYSSILDIRNANGTWNTNAAMLATEHGIYTTSNITAGTVVWAKNNADMANSLCLAVKQQTLPSWKCNNSGIIYLGTHGRGIWTSNNNYQPTAVQDITASSASALNDLLIYPNPMTSEGNIKFNLTSSDNITISIYDMQGKEVKTIALGTQSEGSHLVTFNSSDFPAGAYFASLTGNNFRKVSKFIVVK